MVGLLHVRFSGSSTLIFYYFPFGEGIKQVAFAAQQTKGGFIKNLRYLMRPAPLCHMPEKAPARRHRLSPAKTNPQRQRQKMASKFIRGAIQKISLVRAYGGNDIVRMLGCIFFSADAP